MAHRPPGLRAPSTRPTGTPAWRVRLVILAAALAPLSIWPLATGRLARPLETAAWALLCGLLAASAPGHWARLGAYAQALLLPLTLVWIGAVAGTGMGPSLNTLGSVAAGAYREVWNGVVLAFGAPRTPFLAFGDVVHIEMLDAEGHSLFGSIEQRIVAAA